MSGIGDGKCPNCGGILQIKEDGSKKICIYCDSEFVVETYREERNFPVADKEEKARETGTEAERLFQVMARKEFSKGNIKTWNCLCTNINAQKTFEQCVRDVKKMTEKHISMNDMAAPGVNENLLWEAEKKVANLFESTEKSLFYQDYGVFSKLKKGMLITDKKLYFLSKRKISSIRIEDIKEFDFSHIIDETYINGNEDYVISNIGSSVQERGLLICFLCVLAREMHNEDFRIVIDSAN